MITNLQEKNKHCRETKWPITIVMNQDYILEFRNSWEDFHAKLIKWFEYDIEIWKFDECQSWDLAVSFFLTNTKAKTFNMVWSLPNHMKWEDIQFKVFTHRFDIIN